MAEQFRIALNVGTNIPQLGLGVWRVEPDATRQIVGDALRLGYRFIDTAEGHNNEEGPAQRLRKRAFPDGELIVESSELWT